MELPANQPVVARDRLDVANLVTYLRRETRERPVAILTVAPGQHTPFVTAADLATIANGSADIVTIPTDHLTHAFSDLLDDPQAATYRGACRVYPGGNDWETRPLDVPLRMARDRDEIKALPQLIKQDLRRHLEQRQQAATPSSARPTPSPATGRTPVPGPPTPGRAPHPGPPVPAGHAPDTVATAGDAAALAAHLQSNRRTQPAVVVSRSTGAAAAYADVELLRNDLAGLASVHEITTIEASWAFSGSVPDMCQVYGGAGRVYPTGTGWLADPFLSPLRFAYSPHDRATVTRQLVADAMGMATTGNHTTTAAAAGAVTVAGTVGAVAGDRALVNLPGQFPAVVWPELVEPGLPAERLFRKGMPIRGVLDETSRRIDVTGMRQAPDAAIGHYAPGDTILARVTALTADSCTIELFPRLEHTLSGADVTDEPADLRDLLSVGEVLPVWFGGTDDDEWLLSLRDADPDQVTPAPTILTGGPPWLLLTPAAPDAAPADDQVTALAAPDGFSLEATPDVVNALRRQLDQQAEQLRTAEARIARLTDDLATARTQRRLAVTRRSTGSDDAALCLDPAEQLTFEIELAWARMTQPGEKADHPLRRWRYGPEFIDTLHGVQGVKRAKVIEVIVHVLTGRHTELASRELHQLRTGRGGDDPPVTRAGGETCWRVSLQTKTPGARRLHYWQCNDGSVELSSIRTHDDTRP